MKRSILGTPDTATAEKQRRTSNAKDLSPLGENCGSDSVDPSVTLLVQNNNTLKEKNNDGEASPDLLPSLNDSIVSNDLAAENLTLKKRVAELEESNSKLKDDLAFLEKRHGDVLQIQGNFDEKEKKKIYKIYSENKQFFQRATIAENKIEELEETLKKCQAMVKTKEFLRMDIQHKLSDAEAQLKELQSNIANKNDLILRLNGGEQQQQQPGQSSSKADTVAAVAELQQAISTKEKRIDALQKRLEESYAAQENLKDEKREAISEKENFEKRNEDLREAAKLSKEKITKLESQLEDAQEKLGQIQNDIDQDAYEVSCENDDLKAKVSELRETLKEKNQLIAQLQKDLNVGQVLDEEQKNEELDKAKAKIEELEGKLAHADKELIDMLAEYNDMKAQRDKESAGAKEKIKDLKLEIQLAQDTINDLYAVKAELIAENETLKKDLETSRRYEQKRSIELSDETSKHQQTVEKYAEILQKAKGFMERAYLAKEDETKKAAEATTKAAQSEAKFLQCQAQLTKAAEDRQQQEDQLKNFKEKLYNETVAKEKANKKNEELEIQVSQIMAELLDTKEHDLEWQKKIDDMKAQFEKERKDASVKYGKLESDKNALTKSKEKLEADYAADQKEWQENTAELEKFVQKLTSFSKNK